MSEPEIDARKRGRRSRRLAVWLGVPAVVVTLLVVSLLTKKPADDPLFHDPMANVQTTGATRIKRYVQHPKGPSSFGKPKRAEVQQTFRAPQEGEPAEAVRDRLVRQAKSAGWTFASEEPDPSTGVISAVKQLMGWKPTWACTSSRR
jgi:hypothetical protein